MSSFQAGFAARHDAAASILHQAFATGAEGFAPADLSARATRKSPKSFSPEPVAPRHFSPVDPDNNPTEGWNPLDPKIEPETGSSNAFEKARSAGFAEGLAHAEALARESEERNIALMQSVTHALKSAGHCDRNQLANHLRQTVLLLLSKLVGDIGIAPDLLAGRIEAAADMLADSAESAILRVNPDDVGVLEGKLPATIFPVGDASVERGGFVLESASTIVEEGPALWLEQLAQAIDRVAVPTP
ncbi:MAG: flagellar biosynthesis protein FliH [Sphingomonas sp. 28-66-16]|nr:MAG: flagellar biosynthesis protein FliH [Sphingomonas sp. 28-66-16]